MTEHPAHQIAQMTATAAGELRGYMNPAGPFPWELTDGDHLALLPRAFPAAPRRLRRDGRPPGPPARAYGLGRR